jgi:hypothetical protein
MGKKGGKVDSKPIVVEMGRWASNRIMERASIMTKFYCIKCKKDFEGMSLYEHWSTCATEFLKELNKHKRRRLIHVKQEPSGYLDSLGPSADPQETLLFPFPGENSKLSKGNIQNRNV